MVLFLHQSTFVNPKNLVSKARDRLHFLYALFFYIVLLFGHISNYHISSFIGRDCNCAVQWQVPRRREGSSKGSHTAKCQVRWCHGAAHCERSHASYHGGSNPARSQASQVILRHAVMIFKWMNTPAYPNKECSLSSIGKRAEQAICILKLWCVEIDML